MLDYFALGLLIFVGLVLFYGIILLHDIPYEIAVHRNHPHQDAIHATGWVSLFTLHALWPFLWIWAMAYREDRAGVSVTDTQPRAMWFTSNNRSPNCKAASSASRRRRARRRAGGQRTISARAFEPWISYSY